MYNDIRDYEKIAREFTAVFSNALKCKHCGGVSEIISGNPNSYTKWCCKQAKEDVELKLDKKAIDRLRSRGYTVSDTKKKLCPDCHCDDVVMFTADEDWCLNCAKAIPGI
jgi:hypothetical protein